ncbi:hypothetical protein [Halolamina salifodinae]|uniref:Uncharacterized protein n=1 Tax=Halolamina salifodinae TaxID=1202767 RepID=A0A8T4GSL6_9EURY|nr:hypothetical protein [Halolamina salifodinae]MBP1986091.1 hypothetical protein [Halolamina salifodinae]
MPQVRAHDAYNAVGVTRNLRFLVGRREPAALVDITRTRSVLVARRAELCDAAFATAVCTVAYLGSGSLFVGILAVISAVGTLVELYNWQAGTTYLRPPVSSRRPPKRPYG